MSQRHISIDELSAYLDNEARQPDAIREHLQRCEECARRHAELAKLSSHLRALPVPDVSPAFATRVMAAVRETGPVSTTRTWRLWLPIGLGAAAALVLATVWFADRPPAAPPRVASNPPATVDTNRMMNVIAARIARGEDPGALEYDAAGWDDATPSSDDNLEQLAQAEWFGPLADELEADDDVDTMISSLSPEQVQAFKQLLAAYAREG